jgi:thiaminase/transcriptional activator TenA
MLGLTDRAHDRAAPAERAALAAAYHKATRYEWRFWDSAWKREPWPA